MLKSLFSGVSGLQSHQVAMDVESNNIANVNTVGFKYSRANFSDLLAQTKAIATAPQGQLGGKNPVQVGLGSTVSSMTRIFSQGSVQNSDKNTDVAIQGDGFFIISPDGGNTYKYTRAGDFKFDAGGNFVDNNGFVAQGWLQDKTTGKVDSTAPITNINIAPGLTTPAQATQEIVLKANLNSGNLVESFSPAYRVASSVPTNPPSNANLSSAIPAQDNNKPSYNVDSGDLGVMFNAVGEGFALQKDQGVWISFRETVTRATSDVPDPGNLDITLSDDAGVSYNIIQADSGSAIQNANAFAAKINQYSSKTGVEATVDASSGNPRLVLTNKNSSDVSHNIRLTVNAGDNSGLSTNTTTGNTAFKYTYIESGANPNNPSGDKTFTTMAELRQAMEVEARNFDGDGDGTYENAVAVSVDESGKFKITNTGTSADDYDINLQITPVLGSVSENVFFTKNMKALSTVLPKGKTAEAFSQSFNAATHSSSIDVFDSLGSKHTVRMAFRKVKVEGETSKWDMTVTVPEPGELTGGGITSPKNEIRGNIRFNADGSFLDKTPPVITYSANNGSKPGQTINFSFGTADDFDGMTSFDSRSSTSGISQDGFTGGDLVGIRIDQSGTLVGSFSNGRSFGLAQIAMAKFTNNEGLSVEGGNVYIQTANSGDPIIGTAATSGRGFIQSSALEASNVDLSRALTQLIIIQRGFQANGKTITTSDQLLQTLIGLKN
jgi:flagellar hook protein FlgE